MTDEIHPRKVGLVLCGGGLTGAMYEVGCLAALEDAFQDFRACDFDLFIGSSTGATAAMALAGGVPAQRMYRALLDPADDFFALRRHHLVQLDGREIRRVWGSTIGALRRLMVSATIKPLTLDVWAELDRFYDSLPAGLFTVNIYERFLDDFMTRRGIPKTFAALPRKLLVVATDLDAGTRAVFGEGDLQHVPVARAVSASSALPLLFAPVRIDGRDYVAGNIDGNAHVDLAAAHGCSLVVVINAIVPVRPNPDARQVPTGHGPGRRVRDKGILWVNSQSWRIATEARIRSGIERFRAARPEVDVLLVEPVTSDATMFMHPPMNLAARRIILEEGYTSTLRRLRDPSSPMHRALVARGFVPSTGNTVELAASSPS